MTVPYRKKLIEVALPLEAINAACVEDKNRKTGHIRNIHKWFAPMPLPSWRAMLFATLVDDPSNELSDLEANRARAALFQQMTELAPLDAYRDEEVMRRARATIRASVTCDPPTIVDPFCGGGSTLVEAQRFGLRTVGTDLNPIPVLITIVLCRAVQTFRHRTPISSGHEQKLNWHGADGLLADVRHYARRVGIIARTRLAALYPAVQGGGTAYAWRWAWAVASPNPAAKGGYVPLVSDWLLTRNKGDGLWVQPIADSHTNSIRFKLGDQGNPPKGNVGGWGATCLFTDTPISLDYIRHEGRIGRLRPTLLAVAVQRGRERVYFSGDDAWIPSISYPSIDGIPIDDSALGFRVQQYGVTDYKQLYTPRQANALYAFATAIDEIRAEVLRDAALHLPSDDRSLDEGGEGSRAYADSVCAILGLMLGKMAQSNNILVRWFVDPRSGGGKATPAFDRNVVPMVWDFVETNPFGGSTGDWEGAVQETALKAFDLISADAPPAMVFQSDVRTVSEKLPPNVVIACDPPYYGNIGYADLSDVFFMWMRPALQSSFPGLFGTIATPKAHELIACPGRAGGNAEAREYFRTGFTTAFSRLAAVSNPEYPISIVYALKQAEASANSTSSGAVTGWDVFLTSLMDAGLSVVATWPVRTTTETRMRGLGSNALASAIFVVCRRRSADATSVTRGDFRRALRKGLPNALKRLQQGNIAPVDVAQASIGPAMAIFSSYKQVLEADGRPMSVASALQLINEVLDEYLTSSEGDFDADTRFAITWYEQHGWEAGPFGDAETLAKARNVSVGGVVEAGICKAGGGKVRILKRAEMRPSDYDPKTDERPTIWEFTQHLIRYLEDEGEEAAARLLKKLGSNADAARELAYRLYNTCERKKWAEDARSYNGLILAWPELEKLAARLGDDASVAEPSGKPGKKGAKKKVPKGQGNLFGGDDE